MNIQKENVNISSNNCGEIYSVCHGKFHKLNSDCLRCIFQYLPIVDRIRLERVCKYWQMISQESWYDFKRLNFINKLWGFNDSRSIEKINGRILKKILNRCGQYLNDIEFSASNKRLGPNVLNIVARFCPNIQYVYVVDIEVSPLSIRALANSCHKITSLSLGDCTDECDDELALLFQNNKELRALCVYSNFYIIGKCLVKLNKESIEAIVLENCPLISLKYFTIVSDFPNLRVLMLEHFHDTNNNAMEEISYCSKNLKYLTLALCPFYSNFLYYIGKLNNLEFLDLSSNASVDDATLITIGNNCRLIKNIDISYCSAVTNIGLLNIITLPKLKSLFIQDLEKITDEVFNGMPNLRHMDCSYCSNVKNEGIAKLIASSEKIEHLYLINCKAISNELLEAAIKFTKNRRNNIVLKLHLSNTNIQLSKINNTSPFLQVVPSIIINSV